MGLTLSMAVKFCSFVAKGSQQELVWKKCVSIFNVNSFKRSDLNANIQVETFFKKSSLSFSVIDNHYQKLNFQRHPQQLRI